MSNFIRDQQQNQKPDIQFQQHTQRRLPISIKMQTPGKAARRRSPRCRVNPLRNAPLPLLRPGTGGSSRALRNSPVSSRSQPPSPGSEPPGIKRAIGALPRAAPPAAGTAGACVLCSPVSPGSVRLALGARAVSGGQDKRATEDGRSRAATGVPRAGSRAAAAPRWAGEGAAPGSAASALYRV